MASWFCPCGAENDIKEESCVSCGVSSKQAVPFKQADSIRKKFKTETAAATKQARLVKVWKIAGGAIGLITGFVGCMLLFEYLATHQNFDVFHMYIVEPTPPPGGYRTPLDVPPPTWPAIVMLAAAIASAKIGASVGKKLGSRTISSASLN